MNKGTKTDHSIVSPCVMTATGLKELMSRGSFDTKTILPNILKSGEIEDEDIRGLLFLCISYSQKVLSFFISP